AQNNVTQNTMVVVVKNFNGQPVPGTVVTWTITGQGSLVGGSQSTTDANGQASNQFLGPTLVSVSFIQTTVTASAFGSSVNFAVTPSATDPISLAAAVQANVVFPTLSDTITGASGSTGGSAIRVQVFSSGISGFQGIPNVLIKLVPADASGPQITCAGNTGYT